MQPALVWIRTGAIGWKDARLIQIDLENVIDCSSVAHVEVKSTGLLCQQGIDKGRRRVWQLYKLLLLTKGVLLVVVSRRHL